jgi:hypothetical protein
MCDTPAARMQVRPLVLGPMYLFAASESQPSFDTHNEQHQQYNTYPRRSISTEDRKPPQNNNFLYCADSISIDQQQLRPFEKTPNMASSPEASPGDETKKMEQITFRFCSEW